MISLRFKKKEQFTNGAITELGSLHVQRWFCGFRSQEEEGVGAKPPGVVLPSLASTLKCPQIGALLLLVNACLPSRPPLQLLVPTGEEEPCPWSPWSPCSQSCGTGLSTRTALCPCPAPHDPKVPCNDSHRLAVEACYLRACAGESSAPSPGLGWVAPSNAGEPQARAPTGLCPVGPGS